MVASIIGAALLPAVVGDTTAAQPESPGLTEHAASDGSTAAHPESPGAAIHCASVGGGVGGGGGGGGGGFARKGIWATAPVIVPVASIAPPADRAMLGADSVPLAVSVAPGGA